jgi:uncharacterized damage-inducible protein DinB
MYGQPWFGRSFMSIAREVDPEIGFEKPVGHAHSLLDLLYHTLTWSDFTLKRLENDPHHDLHSFEKIDWRVIDPAENNWGKGLALLDASTRSILTNLQKQNDDLLDQKVEFREYNFDFLLNGLIQHNIYHLGQIAFLHKLLKP